MKRKPVQLAKVPDPRGRMDVMAYRVIERLMEKLERERGAVGLRERLLPIVEEIIGERITSQPIPAELLAIINVCIDNRGLL